MSPDPDPRFDPDDLSRALAREADAAGGRPVDLDAVLRGSRARRHRRRRAVIGVTASVSGLLVVGALAFGVASLGDVSTTAGSSAESASAPAESASESASVPADGGEAQGQAPEFVAPQDGDQFGTDGLVVSPDALNRCGEPVARATETSTSPLTATVLEPTDPVAPGAQGVVRVRVANTGTTVVEGSVRAAPSITVSDAGTTVWHPALSIGDALVPVRLAPGEHVDLDGRFTAASCTSADEQDGTIAASLPPLAPGSYDLSAVVPFVASTGDEAILVVSPTAPLTVR
ncbi:hypothetical protein [Agromyces sp. NPDC058110]|uniref:hypothetical protein n=1 Tax=Agromyces sp. NPDC058110 TaxID=3346345 RepID=UPI0036DC749E